MREFVAEMLDEGPDRHGRRIAQGTDRAALDVVGDPVQLIQILGPTLAVLDPQGRMAGVIQPDPEMVKAYHAEGGYLDQLEVAFEKLRKS